MRRDIHYSEKTILALAMLVLAAASVSATGDENYVRLISNTDYCTDCESVYEIVAFDVPIVINPSKFDVQWRVDKNNLTLRDENQFSFLTTSKVLQNVSVLRNYSCIVPSGNTHPNGTDIMMNSTCTTPSTTWVDSRNITLNVGEKMRIKVKGTLDVGRAIDNVIVIEIDGVQQKYTQWVFWNSSVKRSRYKFEQDGNDTGNLSNTLSLTAIDYSNITFKVNNYSLQANSSSDNVYALDTGIGGGTNQFAMSGWFYLTSTAGNNFLLCNGNQGAASDVCLLAAGTALYISNVGTTDYNTGLGISAGQWTHLTFGRNASDVFYVIENATLPTQRRYETTFNKTIADDDISIGTHIVGASGESLKGYVDNVYLLNATPGGLEFAFMVSLENDTVPPSPIPSIVQASYNVTSATGNGTVWRLNTNVSVNTTTPTPTVLFNTTVAANCSIGLRDWNYSQMTANDSTTKCSTANTTGMNCTLPASQSLMLGAQNLYISCKSPEGENGNTSTSGALNISLIISESSIRSVLDGAITNVLGNPAIYTDQQIYVRRLNGTQQLATFDKVAVSGNQRWAFNYLTGSDTYTGWTNLTPVLYVYETTNLSTGQLQTEVEAFIRNTRN